MKTNTKSIHFKLKLKGQGIVNFTDTEMHQKFLNNQTNLNYLKYYDKNVKYAKKNFYVDEFGEVKYKLKISSDCLRNTIFNDFHSPSLLSHTREVLMRNLGSMNTLLRGTLLATKKETLKRKSPVLLCDAEQTNNSLSTLEVKTRSGQKAASDIKVKEGEEVLVNDSSDNTFYYEETVGETEYETIGTIDLSLLQFISLDPIFDRYFFNDENYDLFKLFLSSNMPSFADNQGVKYFKLRDTEFILPEKGILLSNEDCNNLVRHFFNLLLKNNRISRKGGFAEISSIQYKIVNNVLTDTIDNEDGWTEIKNFKDVNDLKFHMYNFYTLATDEDIERLKLANKNLDAYNEKNAKEKKEKADKKKADKLAKEANKTNQSK